MVNRLTRLRTLVAIGAVLAAVAIGTVTFVAAQQGDGSGKLLPPGPIPTATPTAAVPSSRLTLDQARTKYLAAGSIASLDSALVAGDADKVADLWKSKATQCFVGSGKTGSLCEGLAGPTGTAHDVSVVQFQSYESAFTIAWARDYLHKVLDGNPARLVMVARDGDSGHLFLGYEVAPRAGIWTNPPMAVQYLYLEADPSSGQPIVVLGNSDSTITPVAALHDGSFGGAIGDIVAVDEGMLRAELQREP